MSKTYRKNKTRYYDKDDRDFEDGYSRKPNKKKKKSVEIRERRKQKLSLLSYEREIEDT